MNDSTLLKKKMNEIIGILKDKKKAKKEKKEKAG